MGTEEESERRHLAELFGPPDGEVDSGTQVDRISVLHWATDDEDDPLVYFVTVGLGTREALAGAERYELGLELRGAYSAPDVDRVGRTLLAVARRLANGHTLVAPERVVAIEELDLDFPGRPQALVTDFMYRGPDLLPLGEDGGADTARLLFLRPLFQEELRWARSMSQVQVGQAFFRAGVRFADSERDPLLMPLVPVDPSVFPGRSETPSEAAPTAPAPPTRDVKGLYDSLESWLREHSPKTYADLGDPVSPDDLRALERALGRRLPDDLRTALQIHDGRPALDGYTLISAARIRDRYEFEMENVDQPSPHPADGTCRPVVWSRGWIPFAEDGGQNFRCIDLDPGPKGTAGQVISWERSYQAAAASNMSLYGDGPQWKSFSEWLGWIVDACLAGEVDIDSDGLIFLK